jgi:hypothetical protein
MGMNYVGFEFLDDTDELINTDEILYWRDLSRERNNFVIDAVIRYRLDFPTIAADSQNFKSLLRHESQLTFQQ